MASLHRLELNLAEVALKGTNLDEDKDLKSAPSFEIGYRLASSPIHQGLPGGPSLRLPPARPLSSKSITCKTESQLGHMMVARPESDQGFSKSPPVGNPRS